MDTILKLNEFFVEGGHQNVSHVLLHITEPSTPEEIAKGYFFAICEINNAESKQIARLQDIIDRAENDYYEIPDTLEKNALEQVLLNINQEALAFVKPEFQLHAVVGALRQPDIMFAVCGSPRMLLFYKNAQSSYQRLDLLKNAEIEASDQNLFSHIIQGKLSGNDYLFAGTPHLIEYFNDDRLEKIITSRPALESAQHIERVLSEIKDGHSFGGLIIHVKKPSGKELLRRQPQRLGPISDNSIFEAEKNTASTMSTSLFPHFNDKLKAWLKPVAPSEKKLDTERQAEINAARAYSPRQKTGTKTIVAKAQFKKISLLILQGARLIIYAIAWGFTLIYSTLAGTIRLGVLLIFAITNHQNRRKIIVEDFKRQWHSNRENIKRLPVITKLVLAALLSSILLGSGSYWFIKYQKATDSAKQKFEQTLAEIVKKKDSIESALVYRDEITALKNYREAKALLQTLTCSTKNNKLACLNVEKNLNDLGTKIRKERLATPELLYSWDNAPVLIDIVRLNNKIISLSSATSTIYAYDLFTKTNSAITTLPTITGFSEGSVPKESDYALFVYDQNKIFALVGPEMIPTPYQISFPDKTVSIEGVVIYNRRLYALNTAVKQIYKHDNIKDGFSQGKPWFKEDGSALTQSQNITIDGDIFTSDKNGKINKFTKGLEQPFEVQGLDPKLGPNVKLWTYTDLPYLYLLDIDNKRLVILEKDGRLKEQIIGNWQNPTGFVIEPTSNIAYILDTNKLYKISLTP